MHSTLHRKGVRRSFGTRLLAGRLDRRSTPSEATPLPSTIHAPPPRNKSPKTGLTTTLRNELPVPPLRPPPPSSRRTQLSLTIQTRLLLNTNKTERRHRHPHLHRHSQSSPQRCPGLNARQALLPRHAAQPRAPPHLRNETPTTTPR